MSDEQDLLDRRLTREGVLKLAAAAGGAGLLASRVGASGAALDRLTAESGRLQVLDWAGYGNDGGQSMFAQYVKRYPQNKPQFTYMGNEADALSKLHAGLKPDLFRPYVDWGFDAILYRADKVTPKARSWGLLFDERYKGKIAWFDDIEMFEIAGLYLGVKDPWNQTDAELQRSQKFLISKKHLVRTNWSSETNLWELFGSGDVWIAYAWPNDWVQMKKKGLKVVYMHPKEKPIAWVGMFMLLKGTPRPNLAHAYVDAWSSAKSARWLEDNYGYGHANTVARPASSDLLHALQLTNPKAVTEPNAYLDRDIPRRALYAKLWEQVKAS